ncbi:prolyl oligopeptidase family serine peptidase [Ktedonobacter racemifer]|uniref:Phospholipase/Carboxylesterase n=1 Tax=Ktedonobacter racemifer DSM 44963 TaxID=485913 RepID=D6TDP6_KTERA|nr:prolyl oligopeptidase family serine peptidase [Ktedonobacter racemifer]EFH90178.1 phospholipase/Carboxylesterase [Ktedonobacter racemifer DSM 44963]
MHSIQQEETLHDTATNAVRLRYLLHLPDSYEMLAGTRWPLVLFLHGVGERGDNLDLLKKYGPPRQVEEGERFPFILISPQCPDNTSWSAKQEDLIALLDEVTQTYSVDTNRVYATGVSMGGYGTWELVAAYPEHFAAAIPICGGGDPTTVANMRDVPVWAFHGAKDTVIPLRASQTMIDALEQAGGKVKLTIYPEAGHDSWTPAYADPQLYSWLLEHSKVAETR